MDVRSAPGETSSQCSRLDARTMVFAWMASTLSNRRCGPLGTAMEEPSGPSTVSGPSTPMSIELSSSRPDGTGRRGRVPGSADRDAS